MFRFFSKPSKLSRLTLKWVRGCSFVQGYPFWGYYNQVTLHWFVCLEAGWEACSRESKDTHQKRESYGSDLGTWPSGPDRRFLRIGLKAPVLCLAPWWEPVLRLNIPIYSMYVILAHIDVASKLVKKLVNMSCMDCAGTYICFCGSVPRIWTNMWSTA